ncbi:hypothetical protein HY995_03565 [Candidatus Micrarchaeota archaeon]|nr:hypothetical protein [Candidatus Micrarchaeota archaeon]
MKFGESPKNTFCEKNQTLKEKRTQWKNPKSFGKKRKKKILQKNVEKNLRGRLVGFGEAGGRTRPKILEGK